jgi:hypothetical protein
MYELQREWCSAPFRDLCMSYKENGALHLTEIDVLVTKRMVLCTLQRLMYELI